MRKNRNLIVWALFIAMIMIVTACNSGNSKTAKYPDKPIKIIVPWSAGGSSDSMMRTIAEIAPKYFNQNFTVVNKEGAGGTIATTEFVNEKADGYSICLEAVGVFTTQPFLREVKYKIDDFKPIIGLTNEPIIMVAAKQSGIKNLDDLKSKDSVSFGFSGAGSLIELCQKKLFEEMKREAEAVPFDGESAALTALLGGHIDVGAAHPGKLKQYIESGDLIPLGIFNAEREKKDLLKEIPTFKEQGYDITMSVWKFLVVPKNTPDEVVAIIHNNMSKVLQDEKFSEFAESMNLVVTPYSSSEILDKIEKEAKVNEALIKGVK